MLSNRNKTRKPTEYGPVGIKCRKFAVVTFTLAHALTAINITASLYINYLLRLCRITIYFTEINNIPYYYYY